MPTTSNQNYRDEQMVVLAFLVSLTIDIMVFACTNQKKHDISFLQHKSNIFDVKVGVVQFWLVYCIYTIIS